MFLFKKIIIFIVASPQKLQLGTAVNRTCPSLYGGSLETTPTVSMRMPQTIPCSLGNQLSK